MVGKSLLRMCKNLTLLTEFPFRTEGRLSPLPTRALKTTGKNSSKKGSSEHTTHVRSRQSPYLKSNEQRFPVPDFLVAWQVSRNNNARYKSSIELHKFNTQLLSIQWIIRNTIIRHELTKKQWAVAKSQNLAARPVILKMIWVFCEGLKTLHCRVYYLVINRLAIEFSLRLDLSGQPVQRREYRR